MSELTKAERLGHQPVDAPRLPAVNVAIPSYTELARAIVSHIPAYSIMRKPSGYVTVEAEETASDTPVCEPIRCFPMSMERLASWLEQYMVFVKGSGEDAKRVLPPDNMLRKVLYCDTFRKAALPLHLAFPVLLPVWAPREEGKRRITLATPGYDPTSQCYFVDTLPYAGDFKPRSPQVCRRIWSMLMHTFPWKADSPAEEQQAWLLPGAPGNDVAAMTAEQRTRYLRKGPHPCSNRSAVCCLALMLSQFCRRLFRGMLPMGLYSANQSGSGKSLLAWLSVAPVWGMPAGSTTPGSDDEMIKKLNSAIMNGDPYYILDDIPSLASKTINMVATTPTIKDRKLGGNEQFHEPNFLQLFATGNNLTTTPDIERRSLIVDLFVSENAVGRDFGAATLTKEKVCTAAWRADLLRFLLSLVMNWSEAGCPALVKGAAKSSFEEFAEVVGSILVHNGFASPCQTRPADASSGDLIGRTREKFLARMVGEVMHNLGETTKTFTTTELVDYARGMGYLLTLTGGKDPARSLGRKLSALRGRDFQDSQGRDFSFGKGEDAGSSFYTFSLL